MIRWPFRLFVGLYRLWMSRPRVRFAPPRALAESDRYDTNYPFF